MESRRGFVCLALVFMVGACGGGNPTAPSASSTAGGGSATVTSVTIGAPPIAQVGGALQVAAFAQYSNLTTADVTTAAVWTSSNTQIASFTTFAGLPLLQTLRPGVVTISAAFGGRTGALVVTIQ